MTTRATAILFAAFVVGFLIALRVDSTATAEVHVAVGIGTWVFLLVALALQAPAVRVQVAILVVIATTLEVVGSIIWGAYRYRLGDLPLFVPAGHGIFYLVALRTAALPWLERHRRAVVWTVTAGASAQRHLWSDNRGPTVDLHVVEVFDVVMLHRDFSARSDLDRNVDPFVVDQSSRTLHRKALSIAVDLLQ